MEPVTLDDLEGQWRSAILATAGLLVRFIWTLWYNTQWIYAVHAES